MRIIIVKATGKIRTAYPLNKEEIEAAKYKVLRELNM